MSEKPDDALGPPGIWHCPVCPFVQVFSTLRASDGAVGANLNPDKDRLTCPNDDHLLEPVTWKGEAEISYQRAEEQMRRAIAAEAKLDNLAANYETAQANWDLTLDRAEASEARLAQCAEWFEDYANQHRAKHTPEGDAKAQTNAERAAYARALAPDKAATAP